MSFPEINREYAPGVTDPDEFQAMVDANQFSGPEYQCELGLRMMHSRLGWLQQAVAHGPDTVKGSDIQFMTMDEVVTEMKVTEAIIAQSELLTEQ